MVFSFGAGSTMEDAVKLVSAMQALADRQKALPESSAARVADGDADDAASGGEVLPVMAVCPRDAFFAGKERCGKSCLNRSPRNHFTGGVFQGTKWEFAGMIESG